MGYEQVGQYLGRFLMMMDEEEPHDPVMLEALQKFGDMLRTRRQQSEWSYYRMWEKTNVPPSTISAVENGQTWPSAADREAISDFLGYGVDALDKIVRQLRREQAPNVISLADHRK